MKGYGDGYGNGDGEGYGDGDGYGNGYGNGDGDGYGNGYGNGDGGYYDPPTVSTYEHEPDIRLSLCSQLAVNQLIGSTP